MPTRQISPVLRQQTVGVPENEMSFSNSCKTLIEVRAVWLEDKVELHTMRVRWKQRSTNTSSSSVRGICKAIKLGRNTARALTMRKMSVFSNLLFRK